MSAKAFLISHIEKENREIRPANAEYIHSVADDWMDDEKKPTGRYSVIKSYYPTAKRILDMASGAGGFVFHGLLAGYDVDGIDPELWKRTFLELKAKEKKYPEEWLTHFYVGYGEKLPFEDNSYDFISSFQTIEHVQNPQQCISEMIRATRPGGGIHIVCPDYSSTYEPHYRMAWLPLFPKELAKRYVLWRNGNPDFIDSINYITPRRVVKMVRKIEKQDKKTALDIVNLNKEFFKKAVAKKGLPFLGHFYYAYVVYRYTKNLFQPNMDVNILINVREKREYKQTPQQ